jgi:hypothetical protein
LWWSSIVSSCCLGWKFSNIPFTLSFAKAFFFYLAHSSWNQNQKVFPKGELQPTKGFLWDFHEISIGFLWYYYWVSVGFLWVFHGISMIPMGFPWYFYDISIGFQ